MLTSGFPLNPLVRAIDTPPIPEAQGWRALYDGRFGPMIDLSQAVPSKAPPQTFLARLGEAAASGDIARYGPILGDGVLREAHAAESARAYGATLLPENVAITAGCNMAFVVAMMLVAKAGDEVILPAPFYFNHKMTLDMLGIAARILPTRAEAGFVPDVEEARRLIGPGTRAIVLVTPNNPTGAIYPPEVIEAFGRLCLERGLALILDETYRDFLSASDMPPHRLFQWADWGRALIQLYSFSKAHAIPGHRLGAMIAGSDVIGEIAKILDSVQICPARPAQAVVAWAIEALRDWRAEEAREIVARGSACQAAFSTFPRWSIDQQGAYFAFLRHPFTGENARSAAKKLAVEAGILGLPGSYFGPDQETHLRLAVANVGIATLAQLPGRLAALEQRE